MPAADQDVCMFFPLRLPTGLGTVLTSGEERLLLWWPGQNGGSSDGQGQG